MHIKNKVNNIGGFKMSSEKNAYPIKFRNIMASNKNLKVIVKAGYPNEDIPLPPSEDGVQKEFTPDGDKLEFVIEIDPEPSEKVSMVTHHFSTLLDYEFNKNGNDKKWKLKFKGLNNSITFNDGPTTNVEVGVNEGDTKKQKQSKK